jgi:hypothetical protein
MSLSIVSIPVRIPYIPTIPHITFVVLSNLHLCDLGIDLWMIRHAGVLVLFSLVSLAMRIFLSSQRLESHFVCCLV